MLEVDRCHFAPRHAYQDSPQSIGHNATIRYFSIQNIYIKNSNVIWPNFSAPHMHAYALEVLEPVLQEGANVLDVGSGSGYLTACMGVMVNCICIIIEYFIISFFNWL